MGLIHSNWNISILIWRDCMKESKRESISKTVLRLLAVLTILSIISATSCMDGVTIAEKPGKVAVAGNKVYCVFQNGVKCKN